MTPRLLLVLVALLVLAAPARAEVGDLALGQCFSLTDTRCATSGPTVAGAPAITADGAGAYTYARGVLVRHTRSPEGRLTPIDCIGPTGAAHGCAASATGLVGFGQSFSQTWIELSADGEELYVSGNAGLGTGVIVHFNRAPNGTLTFGSCISEGAVAGCAQQPKAYGAAFVLSGDGEDMYTAGEGVGHLSLAPDGTPSFVGCAGSSYVFIGCDGSVVDSGAVALLLSADGTDLYVGFRWSLQHFKRQPNGSLTAIRCYNDPPIHVPCAGELPLQPEVYGMALSPDGTSLYALGGPRLLTFDRAGDGALSFDACLSDIRFPSQTTPLCPEVRGLGALTSAAVSPDGAWLYTGGEALTILRRAAGGALTRVRCLQQRETSAGCTRAANGLTTFMNRMRLGPGGAHLYAGSSGSLAVFDRIEYVAPPPIDTTPLSEASPGAAAARDARSVAEPARPAPSTPAPAPAAFSPGLASTVVRRHLRNERVRRCVVRPSCARPARRRKRAARRRPPGRSGARPSGAGQAVRPCPPACASSSSP